MHSQNNQGFNNNDINAYCQDNPGLSNGVHALSKQPFKNISYNTSVLIYFVHLSQFVCSFLNYLLTLHML